MSESLKSWPSRHCLLPHRRAKTSQHDIHFQILRNLCVCVHNMSFCCFFWLGGGFSFHGSQNHSESFTYNSCIIIRNDSESPTNQLRVSTLQQSPWLSLQGPDCKAPMMDLGKSLKVARGWKYHHHLSLSCFPSRTLQTKCTKNRNQHTTSCYYVDASFRSKIFLHNPHVPWFLVLLSRDEHEPQPATGSPGSHWVPPRAALVAFLRRFTLEKPGLELIMQRSTAGITDISQRSSDVSASGKDSQKVSKGDCWKVGDSQHQNQS